MVLTDNSYTPTIQYLDICDTIVTRTQSALAHFSSWCPIPMYPKKYSDHTTLKIENIYIELKVGKKHFVGVQTCDANVSNKLSLLRSIFLY